MIEYEYLELIDMLVITEEKVIKVIARVSNNKVLGLSSISNEVIKAALSVLIIYLT